MKADNIMSKNNGSTASTQSKRIKAEALQTHEKALLINK